MLGTFTVWQVVTFVGLVAIGYLALKLLKKWDDKVENRRRKAFLVAAEFSKRGFKRLPVIFNDYAVGDYSGIADEVHSFADLIQREGETAIARELDAVFKFELNSKLATEEGKALVVAALAAVTAAV